MIKFASRVRVLSVASGVMYYAHAELAAAMLDRKQVKVAAGIEKKILNGRDVYVNEIFLPDYSPAVKDSQNKNSSKTTFRQTLEVVKFNERGEKGRGVIMANVQTHKKISRRSVGLYGLRHPVGEGTHVG